jgi:hypothetical protein
MRRDLQGSAAGSDNMVASGMAWAQHVQSLTRCDKAQTQARDSRTQAGEQVQLPKADAQTDPAVKTGEQLSEDNAQADAVLDQTENGKSVGLANSGSTSSEANFRPLQRRVVAKKRKHHSCNSATVEEDKSESALACTDDVEMAMIEPQTSNQTDTDNAGKRSRKEKKLGRYESRPITIYREPNKITFAF